MIFGAAALGSMGQQTADDLLSVLGEVGVNHIDTAADYGDSELRLRPFLAEHRQEFFLATKTAERKGDDARASLERSLDRLGVDQVDLIQLHNLVEEDEWAVAHAPGGAVQALMRARDEGLARHVGVTGHGLRIASMHLRSLERADFASVLLPYNFALLQDRGYRADVERLLETCDGRDVAVQTIKSAARRRWTDEDEGLRYSWYKPTDEQAALGRSVRYVLSHPQLFLISSSDARLLRPIVDAASTLEDKGKPSDEEMSNDVARLGMERLFDGGLLERI